MNKPNIWTTFCAVLPALCVCSLPALATNTGIDLGVDYTQDYFHNVSGGQQRGSGTPGTINLDATIDGRTWGGSSDDTLYFDALVTTGSSISNRVGDLQGLDNIEASNTANAFSAWYQHRFKHSGVRMRLGLQDYNALFNTLEPASVLINSSFGLDPTIAQASVSTFPITSVGAVVQWKGASGVYAMGGIYDGTPSRRGHPDRTHIDYRSDDGVLSAFESGITDTDENRWKLALGGWERSSDFRDPDDRPRRHNHGIYLIGNARLFGGDAQQPTVDAFFQLGTAEQDRNALDHYIGAGVNVSGLLPSRPEDILGFGIARANTGQAYRRSRINAGRTETVFELTWSARINKYFRMQPDIQYLIDPGADTTMDNALVLGLRVQLSL
jgi:porin